MCRRDGNNRPMSQALRIGTLDVMSTPRAFTVFALLTAAVGIVVQMLGGPDYPVGILVFAAAAGIVWFVPWRGAPVAAILVALSHIFGLLADQADRLIDIDAVLDTLGLWIQTLGVVGALVSAVVALANPRLTSSDA
jgi:hypothetical protein